MAEQSHFGVGRIRHPRPAKAPPKYRAARSFFLVILVASVFLAWSCISSWLISQDDSGSQSALLKRDRDPVGALSHNKQCHLVHSAKDRCAFVRQNCPDEEAGLFSYLQLYYCDLPKAKPLAFSIIIIWMGFLFASIGIAASDFFCINLSTISSILGLSESVAGVTFLAFGNGSPDVFSTFAAMKTHSGSLAVGELIGAASFITAVVAGSMALVRPFRVARKSFVRDVLFFTVAAAFSIGFLADGHLALWECIVMVVFYLLYVIFVVAWHWVLQRKASRRAVENAARSHFHLPGTDEDGLEPYQDDFDEETRPTRSRATTRTVSMEDFANLERGGSPEPKAIAEEIDANDETRDRYLAEISNNMRVSRPRTGERRSTITPIRPSLVGALEFNAVLSSLQKSRNIQAMPLNIRRYSDDPTFTTNQQQDSYSIVSEPEGVQDELDAHAYASDGARPETENDGAGPRRIRAVSANDALGLRPKDQRGQKHVVTPKIDLLAPSPPQTGTFAPPEASDPEQHSTGAPKLSLAPPEWNSHGDLVASPVAISPRDSGHSERLSADAQSMSGNQHGAASPEPSAKNSSRPVTPKLAIPRVPGTTPRSAPHSPFPAYYDDPNFVPTRSRPASLLLPSPRIDSDTPFFPSMPGDSERRLPWWPYRLLPPPGVLCSTLFPTLYTWDNKNFWERLLGIIAAPSVFLFVITLPTVEKESDDEEYLPDTVDPDPGILSGGATRQHQRSHLAPLPAESPSGELSQQQNTKLRPQPNYSTISPTINVTAPDSNSDGESEQSQTMNVPQASSPKSWNRWLLAIQLFTGPFLVVLLIWANTSPSRPRALLMPALYSLLSSLIALGLLLTLTSPSKPPRYRYLICYLGFVISIAWISTIANEVVGVLKALGIILHISDAILGLTIFAVGNSCGDLVADITVARLGYPVMALSACFGGPMLNILLGIGLSGSYMTIIGAEKRERKHPGRPIEYRPYQVEVGGTLLISGATLLFTLVALLVVVPLRGWWMDRRVGWGLVILWVASTIGNLIAEYVVFSRPTS